MVDLAYSIADQNVATTKSIGIYNFSVHLLRHLVSHPDVERMTVFTNETIAPPGPIPERVRMEEHNSALQVKVGRIMWDQWGVYRQAEELGHRWLLLPKGFSSLVVRPQKLRVATFVHDIMGEFYRDKYPGFWPRLELFYFGRCLAATVQNAHVVFTNTEFSKSELLALARRRGWRAPKVVVAGYGFEAAPSQRVEKTNRILLFASNMPHKRTDIAIRFLDHWVQQTKFDGSIDCIGIIPPDMEKPHGSHWNWIGRVPPAEGRAMIRQARAVVYVSEYEGFGMPPVEAVLEGTCPVFSAIPPLCEVMGDAGRPFSNDSAESFVEAMNHALSTAPETIATWAAALIQRHNWPAVTQRILDQLSTD